MTRRRVTKLRLKRLSNRARGSAANLRYQTSLKPCSGEMKQAFANAALEAVLAAAQRPPSNEDSRTERSA